LDYVLLDKKTTFIDKKARIGKNVIIYENNRIEGACNIADNVTIFPNCFISNSIIGKGSKIYSAIIDKSKIGTCVSIGPFSIIRRCDVGDFSKVGAFSELKNSNFKENTTISTGSIVYDDAHLKK